MVTDIAIPPQASRRLTAPLAKINSSEGCPATEKSAPPNRQPAPTIRSCYHRAIPECQLPKTDCRQSNWSPALSALTRKMLGISKSKSCDEGQATITCNGQVTLRIGLRHIETSTSPLTEPQEKTPLAITKKERETTSAVPFAPVTLIAFLFSWTAGFCKESTGQRRLVEIIYLCLPTNRATFHFLDLLDVFCLALYRVAQLMIWGV